MGILSTKDVGATPADDELRKILESKKAVIKVVGCGGAGGNTISRMMQVGIVGAESIAVNTDAQDLLYTDADVKVLIGKEITGGLGAGAGAAEPGATGTAMDDGRWASPRRREGLG